MEIKISTTLQNSLAIYHEEGLVINKIISNNIREGLKSQVSFVGVESCSTQFLNAAIGKLYLEFEPKLVDSLLSYNFANNNLFALKIKEVRENAINSNHYNSLIDEATA
jgi:hypothetical protein